MDIRSGIYSGAAKTVERFVRWTTVHPWTTLVSSCLVTLIFGYWGFSIPLKTNIEDLFPETTPHVVRAKETRERLSSSTQVLLVAVSPEKDANIRFVTDLVAQLRTSPLIESMEYRRDISFFKKNAVLFMDEDELRKSDRRLKRAIKRAVEKDLGPFDSDEEAGGDAAPEATKPSGDDGLVEDFGAPKAAEKKAELVEDFGAPKAAEKKAELVEDFGAPKAGEKKAEIVEDFGAPEGQAKEAEGEEEEEAEGAEPEGEKESTFAVPTEDEVREKYGIGSLSEYETNADGTIIALRIFPSFAPAEVTRSRELLKLISGTIEDMKPASYNPEMDWAMEGDYHKKIEEIDILYRDLLFSTFSALGLIFLLIAVFFRRPRIVVLTFIPLTAGLAWTMGFAYATMGSLNLVTAFIFAVLSGLGVEYSMHVAERYVEEREAGRAPAEAAVATLKTLSRAMFGSAVMTSCGFLALMIFEFRGFSQFGAIAGIGIPLCLLVVYLFFPPMVVVFNRFWPEKPYVKRLSVARATGLYSNPRRAVAVLAGVAVAAGLLLPGLAKVDFEPDMKKVMTPSAETHREKIMDRYKKEVSKGSASPIALLTDSIEETRTVHRYLERYKENFEHLQTISSVFTFVPDDQERKLEIVKTMRERLQRKLGALKGKDLEDAKKALEYLGPEAFAVDALPDWVRKKFTDKQGKFGTFVILGAWGNKANALRVGEITRELDDIEVNGKVYHTSASYYILKDVYDIVRKEGPLALLLAAAAALIMVLLDFAKFWHAIIAFFPVLLGVGCFVGLMGWTGENFTMFNMIILPSIFGTSIDTCTHVLHRVREEGPDHIGTIANTTGAATFLGAATNALGFGSMLFATNPGLANIGKLAPLGLLLCWLVCLNLACSWGYLRERWTRRAGAQA